MESILDEVRQIKKAYHALKDDSAFVLWFLRAFLTDTEESAKSALTGGQGDKNLDAILCDPKAKQIYFVQGKLRGGLDGHRENRNDVLGFADVGELGTVTYYGAMSRRGMTRWSNW
jgi:hypothetical protein